MITFLGFDTVLIHYRYNSDNVQTFELFYKIGIKHFVFLFDYDPRIDSISIMRYKTEQFKKSILESVAYRVKIKCVFNLILTPGAAFNRDISRLFANRKNKSLFISLPLFTDVNYDSIARDINHLLYKKNISVIFTSFDKIIETSNLDFCLKFINNPRISLAVDLNYIFDPNKTKFFNSVLTNNSNILPVISSDISNYAGALAAAEHLLEKYGKKNYYKFCSQVNRSSLALI